MASRRVALGLALVLAACTADPPVDDVDLEEVALRTVVPVRVERAGEVIEATALRVDDDLAVVAAIDVVGADRIDVRDVLGDGLQTNAEIDAVAECEGLALLRADGLTPVAAPTPAATPPPSDTDTPDTASPGPAVAVLRADAGEPTAVGLANSSRHVDGVDERVVVDEDGVVVSLVADGAEVPATDLDELVTRLREREVTSQLGFVVETVEDGLRVLGVESGATALDVGDVVLEAGATTPATRDALCEGAGESIRVDRGGREYVGTTEQLRLASARTDAEIERAVVRIDTSSGHGSGFYVSEDGLVLTNDHVVSGDLDEVGLVGSDGSTTRGTVVGRSSCNDLALIDAGQPAPAYLEFAPDDTVLDQPIRVVGYPRGVDEYTVRRGEVAKLESPALPGKPLTGNFEHSAQQQPGSSGGPVVNDDGEVVGVVHAGLQAGVAVEPWGLDGPAVARVVEQLRAGDWQHLGYMPALDDARVVEGIDPTSTMAEMDLVARVVSFGSYDMFIAVDGQPLTAELADVCAALLADDQRDLREADVIVDFGSLYEHVDALAVRQAGRVGPPGRFVPLSRRGFRELTDPSGLIGVTVSDRHDDSLDIVPDGETDARGVIASDDPQGFRDRIGEVEGVSVLASHVIAAGEDPSVLAARATRQRCATGEEPEEIREGTWRRTWRDCGEAGNVVVVDWSRGPLGELRLVTVVASEFELDHDLALVRDSLTLHPVPRPPPEEAPSDPATLVPDPTDDLSGGP